MIRYKQRPQDSFVCLAFMPVLLPEIGFYSSLNKLSFFHYIILERTRYRQHSQQVQSAS